MCTSDLATLSQKKTQRISIRSPVAKPNSDDLSEQKSAEPRKSSRKKRAKRRDSENVYGDDSGSEDYGAQISGFIAESVQSVSNDGSESESLNDSGKAAGSTFHYEEYVRELNGRGIYHPNPSKYVRSSKIDGGPQKGGASCADKRDKTRRHDMGRYVILEYFESEEEGPGVAPQPIKRQRMEPVRSDFERSKMNSDTILVRNKFATHEQPQRSQTQRNIFAITKEDPLRLKKNSSELHGNDTDSKTREPRSQVPDEVENP